VPQRKDQSREKGREGHTVAQTARSSSWTGAAPTTEAMRVATAVTVEREKIIFVVVETAQVVLRKTRGKERGERKGADGFRRAFSLGSSVF
jgi:hypothetical protein